MSSADNKKLVQQIYADSANRSGTTFLDNLAEDVTWVVTGEYSWSGKFKGREGMVIRPVKERHSEKLPQFGRVVLKSISVDYYERKGGTEFH